MEFVIENGGVELQWPCSPPGPSSSAHCGSGAGDADDVFSPAKESVTNSEGGGTNCGGCSAVTRKTSSEAGLQRIGSGIRRFRTRPLLPKLPIPPCESGMSFGTEARPLSFTTSTSGRAGGKKRWPEWSHEIESRFKRAWARSGDHSAATLRKAMNAMGGQAVTLAQVKEYSCKQQLQPPHARVVVDLDSSSGECAKWSEGEDLTMRLVGGRSVEDVGCLQHLQEAMAQQMEVMKSVQCLLEEQGQMQAQIEAQHANFIRMLAATRDTSLTPLPVGVSNEEEWVGWSGPSRPKSLFHLDPFRGLEEEHLDMGLLERGTQEAGPVPTDSIDLQQLLLLHPELLRHPHFLHQVLALSGTLCGTPLTQQMYSQQQQQTLRQQEVAAVHLAVAHQFEDRGVAKEAESASLLLMRQLQKSLLEEQLKEQIRRQVQLQQLLLCQLAASQQSALEMPTGIPPAAPHFAGAGRNGAGMGFSSEGLLGISPALWG